MLDMTWSRQATTLCRLDKTPYNSSRHCAARAGLVVAWCAPLLHSIACPIWYFAGLPIFAEVPVLLGGLSLVSCPAKKSTVPSVPLSLLFTSSGRSSRMSGAFGVFFSETGSRDIASSTPARWVHQKLLAENFCSLISTSAFNTRCFTIPLPCEEVDCSLSASVTAFHEFREVFSHEWRIRGLFLWDRIKRHR